ncbi:hypothetical protein P8452_71485 [Trifolium repens]|nr:hypothetical protein P8452_71485 [Trifolium repens]
MPGVKIRKSKTSSSSTRSPSPPSATSPPKNSGNQSSSNTSFKSLSDHYNDAEIESSNPEINQNLVNIVQTNPETEHATQSKNQNIVTSQILIGTVPINIQTISAVETVNVEPIQCSQTNVQTETVTPPPTTKIATVTKTDFEIRVRVVGVGCGKETQWWWFTSEVVRNGTQVKSLFSGKLKDVEDELLTGTRLAEKTQKETKRMGLMGVISSAKARVGNLNTSIQEGIYLLVEERVHFNTSRSLGLMSTSLLKVFYIYPYLA